MFRKELFEQMFEQIIRKYILESLENFWRKKIRKNFWKKNCV